MRESRLSSRKKKGFDAKMSTQRLVIVEQPRPTDII